MKLAVTVDGVRHEVTTWPVDEVTLERHFGIGMVQAFDAGKMKNEHLYFLGYAAFNRTNISAGRQGCAFDDFLGRCSKAEIDTETVDAVPLVVSESAALTVGDSRPALPALPPLQ
jgi:hypothetical protein